MGKIIREIFAITGATCTVALLLFFAFAVFVQGGAALHQIVPWLFSFVLSFVAGIAAAQVATRKGRSPKIWGVCSFLFGPVLLVLWFMRPINEAETEISPPMMACEACHWSVSSQATHCPRCGHPVHARLRRRWIELFGIVAVI